MSLTSDFVEEMERRILTEDLKIGEKLPSIRKLTEEFHVSRSVINIGLAELRNKNYLVISPRQTAEVADWKSNGSFAVLSGRLKYEIYDNEFVENVLEARSTIECAAARSAAVMRSEDDIAKLDGILTSEKENLSVAERARLDAKFHRSVAAASHNAVYPMVLQVFENLETKLITFFYNNNYANDYVLKKHEQITESIRAKDPELSERLMKELLVQGEEVVRALYKN